MAGRVIDLAGGYSARPITLAEYRSACIRLEDRIFGGNWLYDFGPPSKMPPPLGETLTYGLYHQNELVGWHHSQQEDERTMYMADTGILPEHQGQGIYKRLLPHLLTAFREAGYTLVQSHHRATNIRVIVPKLRAGFVIQGLNLYEGGLNAKLTCALDNVYAQAQHIRSGFQQARGEAARRLGVEALPRPHQQALNAVPMPETDDVGLDLGHGYTLHRVSYETFWAVYQSLEDAAYSSVSFDWERPAPLPTPDLPRYAWLIGYAGQVAGWHYSRQWDSRTAYMVNTAFLPAHRGKGLYTRLLPIILKTLHDEGYELIRSHHHATNNAVIVPKLRVGFRLQGLQVDDHGVMAILNYSFDDIYNDYMDVRSGLRRPSGEVARRLGLMG